MLSWIILVTHFILQILHSVANHYQNLTIFRVPNNKKKRITWYSLIDIWTKYCFYLEFVVFILIMDSTILFVWFIHWFYRYDMNARRQFSSCHDKNSLLFAHCVCVCLPGFVCLFYLNFAAIRSGRIFLVANVVLFSFNYRIYLV